MYTKAISYWLFFSFKVPDPTDNVAEEDIAEEDDEIALTDDEQMIEDLENVLAGADDLFDGGDKVADDDNNDETKVQCLPKNARFFISWKTHLTALR